MWLLKAGGPLIEVTTLAGLTVLCKHVGNIKNICIWLFKIDKYNFYAPSFGEVEGAYWFGPVRLSVCP